MSFTHDDITSLGRTLDGIEFTDGERAALHGIIDAARGGGDDEVSGFALPTFGIALGGFKAAPLGGDDIGWVKAKPLGGDELWVKGKPLGGDDPGW